MSEPPREAEPAAPVNPVPLANDDFAKALPGGCVGIIIFCFGLLMIIVTIPISDFLRNIPVVAGCLAVALAINICAGFYLKRRWWAVFLGLTVFFVECAIAAGLLLWGIMNLKHI